MCLCVLVFSVVIKNDIMSRFNLRLDLITQ